MKRLQFRHNDTIFQTREDVLKYFADIVDSSKTASTVFETSLYAEPLVAKYYDVNGNAQVIFAIGVDSGLTPYHIIDSAEIAELIAKNAEDIKAEELRAIAAETKLQENIDAEQDRAEAVEANLQQQITDNIAQIHPVTENLGENVREEYVLKNAKGEELGSHIKIYKDNSLVGAEINHKGATGVTQNEDGTFVFSYDSDFDSEHEYLYLIYRNENGDLKLVGLDFENFLLETEEGNGIKIIDHKITIRIKSGEKYLNVTADGLQTINIDEAIEKAVADASKILDDKINAEIERSTAADNFISATTYAFSASMISEIERIDGDIASEEERAIAAETFLSGAIDTEREERIAEDNLIKNEVKSNQIYSKDLIVLKEATGTTLTLQADETTITKFASASTIYDTSVAILGTLLKVKKVEPTSISVKSRYELQDGNGQLIGDPIEMMVESALIDVRQGKEGDEIDPVTGNYITEGTGDTTMNFVYRLENGTYELMQIVVSEYFTDSHFGRGLNNQDGVVSLKEGDGNEYLVIGEDTIAVIGVNNAIAVAKKEAIDSANAQVEVLDKMIQDASKEAAAYTDLKYSDSTAYTDTRYNESTAYTDSQITAVNSTLDTLESNMNSTDIALSSSIDKLGSDLQKEVSDRATAIQAEASARDAADAVLTASIDKLNTDLQTEIANRATAIQAEASARDEADASLLSSINLLKTDLQKEVSDRATAVQAEASDRDAADTALAASIDKLNTDLQTEIANRATAIQAEASARDAADTALAASIDKLNTDLQTEIANRATAVQAEASARDKADASLLLSINSLNTDLTNAIQSETFNRETADADILSKINAETSARTSDVIEIKTKLSELTSTDSALNIKIETLSGNVITYVNGVKSDVISEIDSTARNLTESFENADNAVFESGKTYTDNAVQNAVTDINNKKVNDVAYDNGNNKIYLKFADGTVSSGFDASEFVVDGMLNSVSFDENTNEIKFSWNTDAGITEFIVPLDKFVDQYTVSTESVSYLKISDDNKISAIVDGNDGYSNTLSTTDFVKNYGNDVYNKAKADIETLSANTVNGFSDINNNINVVSGYIETTIENAIGKHNEDILILSGSVINYVNNSINSFSGSVQSTFNTVENKVIELSGSVQNVINTHNNDITVLSGSVINYVNSNINAFSGSVQSTFVNVNNRVTELSGSVQNIATAHTKGINDLTVKHDNDITILSGNVVTYVNTSLNSFSATVNSNINSVNSKISELSGSVQNIATAHTKDINDLTVKHDNDISSLSGAILSYIDNADNTLLTNINQVASAVTTLNGDKKTTGSVLYNIENEFEKSLITDGVPTTAASLEEAKKVHSLIRQITVNGEMRYFVSSDANEMFYTNESGETVNLNDYITSLNNRVKVLENKLANFGEDFKQTIKDMVKSYLEGTENEIQITENTKTNTLKIGFADNAIFGETKILN